MGEGSGGSVSHKDYVDALLTERNRTNTGWRVAVGATTAAMFFGVLSAVRVYSDNNTKLMTLHNDLIRKGEHERAETTSKMVTKDEFEPVKAFVTGQRRTDDDSGKERTWWLMIAGIVVSIGLGVVGLFN